MRALQELKHVHECADTHEALRYVVHAAEYRNYRRTIPLVIDRARECTDPAWHIRLMGAAVGFGDFTFVDELERIYSNTTDPGVRAQASQPLELVWSLDRLKRILDDGSLDGPAQSALGSFIRDRESNAADFAREFGHSVAAETTDDLEHHLAGNPTYRLIIVPELYLRQAGKK